MKKLSLLFATLLVLVSSIVFSACNNGYKDLKIECNVEQINLVLDDDSLVRQNIIFEISGVKSWGEISIDSKPSGLVKVVYEIKDKQCGVLVEALQPSGEGATLELTHIGSGKSCSVPLNIGMKLQSAKSNGNDFIIQAPDFTKIEADATTGIKTVQIKIPTNKLLNIDPFNYTDTIVWRIQGTNIPTGIEVRSYDKNGEIASAFIPENQTSNQGISTAIKSLIIISEDCDANTDFILNPISILGDKATLHKDVQVKVSIVDLLSKDEIKVTSITHGNDNGILEDLVLINNPDPAKARPDSTKGYDFYSTALIDFKLEISKMIDGGSIKVLQDLSVANRKFKDLYEIKMSTNIDALRLENVDFGQIRVIATSTCIGVGEIKVDFVPKDCVGDIKSFSINIPCTVGERATGFMATNNKDNIKITKDNNYTFSSFTPLNDSNSLGQPFKFQILSTNTLSALNGYKIIINKKLLHINVYDKYTNTSQYIKSGDGKTNIDLTEILSNKYGYQISILKEGREINFYENDDNFVSAPLTSKDTIYIKWIKTNGKELIQDADFGISISNFYNDKQYDYKISNHGFNNTIITYNLTFDRQRTVESISYVPIIVTNSDVVNANKATDAGTDWQFYFEPSMLDNIHTFYGIKIENVFGLNGTTLLSKEFTNINLKISIDNVNLGFALFDKNTYELKHNYVLLIDETAPTDWATGTYYEKDGDDYIQLTKGTHYEPEKYYKCADYVWEYIFNFDNDNTGYENIIIIGKIDPDEDIDYGDYVIDITQNNRNIDSRDLRVYKNLVDEDVNVTIPTADFDGELLQYEYVLLTEKPEDWGNTYYEYAGGEYIQVQSSDKFNPNKSYYQKKDIHLLIDGENKILDLDNSYILSTSKQYRVNIEIKNEDFSNIKGQSVSARVVSDSTNILSNSYISSLCGKDENGNNIIRTGINGSFNTQTNKKNYIQLTYTVNANTYDYYKLNKNDQISINKIIYIYVYEPITSASFSNTMLYKYAIDSIPNSQLQQQYGKETLNINLNNSSTVLNYTDIKWSYSDDGISKFDLNSKNNATFTFRNSRSDIKAVGRIIATLTQFGVQYPIYCSYEVTRAILSEQIVLNTTINSFKSGEGYINLKIGDTFKIEATTRTSKVDNKGNLLEVSLKDEGFSYVICSTTGYAINEIASINDNGLLTAKSAGRAKLIIIAKDILKSSLINITNYFNTYLYLENDAYLIIDIIVSDGSLDNPYLIANESDFKAIADDVNKGDNNKHYALINDIDLSGQAVSFDNFEGRISSFQETATTINRFNIYGIMLTESNPNIFKTLNQNDDGLAVLENINFHIDINYISTKINNGVLIGLIGTNNALIKNITVTISGQVNANGNANTYTIGSIVALNTNTGDIQITDKTLVGVKGQIIVGGGNASTIVLGGVIGENQGRLEGANIPSSKTGNSAKVEYEVYYDNQGATVDIVLQVKGAKDDSAIGGVVGYNKGTMTNVYAMGKVLGQDDAKKLTVNNIGGLIGKNENLNNIVNATATHREYNYQEALKTVTFETGSVFQITNSYSSVQVKGNYNVGGAVGYDEKGSYKKVYYEIYTEQIGVEGNNNVGGLIGNANDSNLYYCYANSFAWSYRNNVTIYDVVGKTNVGGLIGLAVSSRESSFENSNGAMNIVSSVASLSLTGTYNVSGLVGRLDNYGAIYTGYFYGAIDSNISAINANPITKMYSDGNVITNIPYNNVYAIVNGEDKISADFYQGDDGFDTNEEYNKGKPYIKYEDGTSLVSIIPTVIQINKAFDTYYNNSKMYKENALGDYVYNGDKDIYEEYDLSEPSHKNRTRYSLMAELKATNDSYDSLSDYRKHVLILYYYQLSDMSDENALNDYYALNTINMKDIIADDGIIVLPNTFKRFNLRTSDSGVASVLSGGRLLLNGEGQVTITLISTLNPSATASFVVIVRSKVLEFNLYSNANVRDEYKLDSDEVINIVKGSSKIIYADYSSKIKEYNREYAYKQPTNMMIDFTITCKDDTTLTHEDIKNYIELNRDYYIKIDANGNKIAQDDTTTIVAKYVYRIPYGIPITISVNDYFEHEFTITAKPYVVANYKNDTYLEDILVELSDNFNVSFNVATKKGASAVNTDKTQFNMMPADDESKVGVKISTDIELDELYFEIESIGDIWETVNVNDPKGDKIQFIEMLNILYNGSEQTVTYIENDDDVKVLAKGTIDISEIDLTEISEDMFMQSLNLNLKLNDKSHYIDTPFKLQVTLYVKDAHENPIGTTIYINVEPQVISSVIPLNYRMQDGEEKLDLGKAYQSRVIRPGATNIITIDISPNIAIYDYVNIVDTTTQDKILFQQVKHDLSSLDNMDKWVDDGIKLKKYDAKISKLYIIAKLPAKATANITHTIQITTYDKNGNILDTTYLNLEAIMYPAVVMNYVDPNNKVMAVADTREGNAQQEVSAQANLALGVEASITVETYNIDEGTLQYYITIIDSNNHDETYIYGNIIRLEKRYNRYILMFDSNRQDIWSGLLGRKVCVTFTASKSLNGVTETCKATIEFNIKRMVIHSISMDHTNSQDKLYGDWDKEFKTSFYFDYTDISYYYRGYWNVQYNLTNTNPYNYADDIRQDMIIINNILLEFNKWNGNGIEIYLESLNKLYKEKLTSNYNHYDDKGISIVNKNNEFIIKAKEPSTNNELNINNLKLVVDFKITYNSNFNPVLTTLDDTKSLSKEFGFNVSQKTSPFDEYILISTPEEFNDMIDGKYYQLANDITLTNYTPLDTAIGGFNGDGYVITIASFNIDQLVLDYTASGMYVGLFGVLAQNSVIQNLQVEYDRILIDLNYSMAIQEQHTNDINFGGIAGQNLGVITNVKVTGLFGLRTQYVSAEHINLGGITAINGSTDKTKIAAISGCSVELQMKAMAAIGGISKTNYGKITNSNFTGKIISNDSNQYVAEVTTAGFVVENLNGAYISLSYVECGLQVNSYNIQSVGRTAGFVLSNAGTINNCYINQTAISSQGNIGGFVYQSSGNISNSYAYASLGNSLFYNEFIYATNNIGELSNCYVVTDSTMNIGVRGLEKIKTSQLITQSEYKGFIFAQSDYGVWSISEKGPQLLNSGFNSNRKEYDDIFNIYDVETFEGYFGKYSDVIEGKTFRLVRDIDFEREGLDTNPITYNKSLKSNFEGNDMALKNYNIYRTSELDSVGLFANIGSLGLGTYVRNLILQPASIKASSSKAVGALAGVIEGAKVYNITIDNSKLLILGKNAVGGLAGVIKGNFEVMGINSNVSAFATYYYNIGSQYNLYMGKNVTEGMLLDNIEDVSYAGAVAGIVDGYNTSNYTMAERNLNYYYTVNNITISGDLVLIGETVGGAFGLVGERTLVKNLNYNLQSGTLYQGVYVSGGLVGENRGIIQSSNIYAYTYEDGIKTKVNTMTCFNNYARVNGAIAGLNIGGLIDSCTSDINIYTNKDSSMAGGIVGRNVEGSIYNCSVSGSVYAFLAGGITAIDYKYSTIVKQQSGFGTATFTTVKVYQTIQNGVEYNDNCVLSGDYVKDKLYSSNILTNDFMIEFINKKDQYYKFNTDYIDDSSRELVNTTTLFGLAIGMTDSEYKTIVYSNEKDPDEEDPTYNDKLFIDLKRGNSEYLNIEVSYVDGRKTTIKPISTIKASNFKYVGLQAILLYMIAYYDEEVAYDHWSSAWGYTQDYIALIP